MRRQCRFGMALALATALSAFGSLRVGAQSPASSTAPGSGLCTTSVERPPAPAGGQGGRGGGGGAAGSSAAAAQSRLAKITDDVYVIQNPEHTLAQIGQMGGNVVLYLTNEGVILFDSKNERMHDDVVAQVRSLTDKPIKYVVLTHDHGDHAGGSAKLQMLGATVVSSAATRQRMLRMANQSGVPIDVYERSKTLSLGGRNVQLREFCGHTDGDTVAYLPAARVVIVGDLVTTPDTIPQIVNYGDGGTWTDLGNTLDEIANMDFDFLVGGHGPVLTLQEFMKHRDKVAGIRERLRELNRKEKSQEEITQTLLKEYNYGTGPGATQIPLMMLELKGPRTPGAPER